MNYLQKLCETSKLLYQLKIVYVKKLVSLLESSITLDELLKVTSAPFFIPDFNLMSYELDNFTFKALY